MRHDFRVYYGVRYEDVDAHEAVDLINTLPMGSLWRADNSTEAESEADERYLFTRIQNLLEVIAHGRYLTGDPQIVEFPLDRETEALRTGEEGPRGAREAQQHQMEGGRAGWLRSAPHR